MNNTDLNAQQGSRSLNREEDYFEFRGNFFGQETFQYPIDLIDKSDSYMTFFINVDARSSAARATNPNGSVNENIAGQEDRTGQNRLAKTLDGTNAKQGLTAVGEATGLGDTVSTTFENSFKKISDTGAVGSLGQTNKVLKTTITLPMPLNLQTTYNMGYSDQDFGPIDNALFTQQSPQQLKESAGNFGAGIAGAIARIVATRATQSLDIAGSTAVGFQSNLTGVLVKATGQVFNNRREKLFGEVGTRKFGFEFQFAPRNEVECFVVRDIIKTFKYHMHPELTLDRLFYVVPSEFNIAFYHQGRENTWINRISTSVLETMNINYNPGGSWAALENGHPVIVTVSLNFSEIETLTKERIVPNGGEFESASGLPVTKWKGGF